MRKRAAKDQSEDGNGAQLSTSLVRGLEVLKAFRPDDMSLGNQDIIARTGLPKATASRIMFTLSELGYLIYDETLGRYRLGPATVSLGYSALASNAVVQIARPLMQLLADRTGAAIALGARDDLEMVYLSNCRSESLVSLRLNPGSHLPIWKTAMGLAYLVGLEEEERRSLLARVTAAEPENKLKIDSTLDAAMAEYASVGYVTSFGVWHSYISAIGVPFRPKDGSRNVAITCGGISELITQERAGKEIGPALVHLAQTLKARLEGDMTEFVLV